MGKHDIYRFADASSGYCRDCGIWMSEQTVKLSCPPWSSTGEGETTKTNRVCEVGEVKELREIIGFINRHIFARERDALENAIEIAEQLIQKHEGHDKG